MTHLANTDSAIRWARQIQQQLDERGDTGAASSIASAIAQFEQASFQIAVLGKAKRGKSTLINALLGRSDDTLAPIDKLPASSAISQFSWATTERVTVSFRDGRQEGVPASQIRQFVTEEFNPQNKKQVAHVAIEGPFAGLGHQLTLVDTPGVGSLHEHHDALLHAFIPQADAVVFLVTASMPLDQDEVDLLKSLKELDIRKIYFALNKVDDRSAEDVEAAVRHNRSILANAGLPTSKIHLISAKRAFQGDWTGSGVAELKGEIEQFLGAHRGRVLCERFVSRVQQLAAPTLVAISLDLTNGRKSTEQIAAELDTLNARKRSLDSERTLAEREFTRAWDLAVDQFAQRLQLVRDQLNAEIGRTFGETGVLSISKLGRELPTVLNQKLDDALQPIATDFEMAARAASSALSATYPELNLAEVCGWTKPGQNTSSVLAGIVGGGVAVSTGIGLVTAGSAAAAGIAAANATAMATTTTVAAPSLISGLLSLAGFEFLAPMATGTATVAAPAALTATPLWVALAGPVGWTLAGIGLLAVPFSWQISKLKYKDKLEAAARSHVRDVIGRLETERLPALRRMSKSITEEFRIRLDRELAQIESSLLKAQERRPEQADLTRLEQQAKQLGALLSNEPLIVAG